jgi:hypothetical protein
LKSEPLSKYRLKPPALAFSIHFKETYPEEKNCKCPLECMPQDRYVVVLDTGEKELFSEHITSNDNSSNNCGDKC